MVIFAILFILFATVMNLLGVEMTARSSMALFIFETFVLVVFVAVSAYHVWVDPNLSFTLKPFYNPGDFSWSFIIAGTSVAVLSFLGFDIHAKELGLALIAVGILYLAYIICGFKVKTVLPD